MQKQNLAYILVLVCALLWGSTAAVVKLLGLKLETFQILFYSLMFGFITLFLLVLSQKKLSMIKKFRLGDYWHFAYMGFLGVFLYHTYMYIAIANAPAQEAFIINYLWPFLTVIFAAIILKEQLSFQSVFAVILSFIGVFIVAVKGDISHFSFTNIPGDLFAFGAAVFYALFSVLGKKDEKDKLVSMMMYFFFSVIFAVIGTLLLSSFVPLKLPEFLGLAWLGALTYGIAFVLWFTAMKYGNTAKISNLIYLTPILSLVYIYFLTGEKILISSIIGLILVVFGIIMQAVDFEKVYSKILKLKIFR